MSFHFVLPEISTHFVLHDLLRSFRLERPLSSSRVPPWDLLRVLHFLRGLPFEPLSSSSLRDLMQKVLFLVSLATARRVGELQAVSQEVSFSGFDVFLSYLPEFRAKTESSVNPLPRSFRVQLSEISRKSFPFVLSVPYGIISLVLLLFLRVLVLSLCLLALLLGLSLRTFLASFFVMSFLVLPLPPLFLLVPPLLLLLVLLPLLGLIAFVGSRLRGRLRGMPLFPLSLRRLFGLLLLSSPLFISLMSSFLLRMVLAWVLWWRQVQWFRCFWLSSSFVFSCLFPSLAAGSECL